ncbi:hypothetical protein GCM10023065_17720 [Microbacterium laevaniformans]|nr:hypothetical protein GCM10017578_00960 [Microbacterium laevaniformans]
MDALDIATFAAVARTRSPLVDATMPALTRAADRSVLWIAIAGLLALTGRPRARRAAARGVAAIGITSLIANQVSKRLHPRPRPSITQVPAQAGLGEDVEAEVAASFRPIRRSVRRGPRRRGG